MPRYVFRLDANGAVVCGTVIDNPSAPVPPEYNAEGTLQQWQAQGRSFYDAATGTWLTYQPLTAAASPSPDAINATVTMTATLPAGSPDVQVMFQADGGAAYTEPVVSGQASHAYAFASAGTYRIDVSSAHHGVIAIEVIIQ